MGFVGGMLLAVSGVFLFLLKSSSLGCLVFPLLQEAPLVQPFGFPSNEPQGINP